MRIETAEPLRAAVLLMYPRAGASLQCRSLGPLVTQPGLAQAGLLTVADGCHLELMRGSDLQVGVRAATDLDTDFPNLADTCERRPLAAC